MTTEQTTPESVPLRGLGLAPERAAFERWFGLPARGLDRVGAGYKLSSAHTAWVAWQAASKSYVCGRNDERERLELPWRSIDSAPPPQWQWVLIYAADASRTSAMHMDARWTGAGSEWESADDGNRPCLNPTHWIPLPEGPNV